MAISMLVVDDEELRRHSIQKGRRERPVCGGLSRFAGAGLKPSRSWPPKPVSQRRSRTICLSPTSRCLS